MRGSRDRRPPPRAALVLAGQKIGGTSPSRQRHKEACGFARSEHHRLMDLASFKRSLAGDKPPQSLGPALKALWWEAKGDWNKAHGCVQEHEDEATAWVHAYLHRKEGDAANARYWYRRAGKPTPLVPIAREWEAIVLALLEPK
jgi:hypothetical protein